MKRISARSWIFSVLFFSGAFLIPEYSRGETTADGTMVEAKGFVIIINDLVTVNKEGLLVDHETKQDAEMNIQSQVSGTVKKGEDGFWYFRKSQTIEFLNPVMFLTNSIRVPLTIEVLLDELDETEETRDLPVQIKGANDKTGKRYHVRINAGMLAGVLLKPTTR